jgi:pimeloyl-ACP methyl ester carboxylesterase
MLDLLAHLGRARAIWVGHDWGSAVVWSLASHHPDHCSAVANLCVPYIANGFAVANLIALVNREVYPQSVYPAGQWEYQLFYEESFEGAQSTFEADIESTVRALFRKGNRAAKGKPSRTAEVRRDSGWFGGADKAPSIPRDPDVISEEDLSIYATALSRNGCLPPTPGT